MTDPHAQEDLYALITAPEPQPARHRAAKPWPARAALAAIFLLLAALVFGGFMYANGSLNLPALQTGATTPTPPVWTVAPASTAPAAPAAPAPAPTAPPAEPAPAAVPSTPAAAATPPATTTRSATGRPTPGREVQGGPLGKPAPITVGSNSYAFTNLRANGTPVTYDPCRPIHYVTRAANAPAGGDQLIKEAVTAVSRATGLVFIDDGATAEAPAAKRVSYQPDRYGDRWAPLLIAWETHVEEPRFTDPEYGTTVLGLGGSEAISVGDIPFTYVSGQLELNGPALTRMIARDGAAAAVGVIKHELAHVVGLGHVNDPTQLMNESTTAVTTYAAGDLSGLALLGQGQCTPGL